MRKTLQNLYYGNIRPCERRMVPSSELRRAVDTINRCEDQIEEQLSDEGKRLLTKMSDAQQTADNIMALENFILGFRLGVQLMAECMDSNDGDTKEMIEHG